MTAADMPPEPRLSAPRRFRLRSPWAVPMALAAVLGGALVAQPLLGTASAATLPDLTAEELLTAALQAEPTAMSGTLVHTANLGLPELPLGEAMGADPLTLLSGSTTARLWTDGAERSRLALLGTMSEYSVVRDGFEAWTYSSSDQEVVHYTVSAADRARLESAAEERRADWEEAEVSGDLPTPAEAARAALAKVDQSTTVSVEDQVEVAGREAYQLVLEPKSAGTLVDRVLIALDGGTMMPLRVQVWSVKDTGSPATEVGFTDVSFTTPADSVLEFSAPADAAVREVTVPVPADLEEPDASHGADHGDATVIGEGWSAVVEVTGVDAAALLAGDPGALATTPEDLTDREALLGEFKPDHEAMSLDAEALYEQLTTQVPEGRLLSSNLISALVTDDGRVLVGLVPAETLRGMA